MIGWHVLLRSDTLHGTKGLWPTSQTHYCTFCSHPYGTIEPHTGNIRKYLVPYDPAWHHMEPAVTIWHRLVPSGTNSHWPAPTLTNFYQLAPPGNTWHQLAPPGAIWPPGEHSERHIREHISDSLILFLGLNSLFLQVTLQGRLSLPSCVGSFRLFHSIYTLPVLYVSLLVYLWVTGLVIETLLAVHSSLPVTELYWSSPKYVHFTNRLQYFLSKHRLLSFYKLRRTPYIHPLDEFRWALPEEVASPYGSTDELCWASPEVE